jgi:hypothetical protein
MTNRVLAIPRGASPGLVAGPAPGGCAIAAREPATAKVVHEAMLDLELRHDAIPMAPPAAG